MKLKRLSAVAASMIGLALSAITHAGDPIDIGDRRELFVDRHLIDKLDRVGAPFRVDAYGALSIDAERYPLFSVRCESPVASRPWALVTGGVHGYETSGVQGALEFLETTRPNPEQRARDIEAYLAARGG